MSAKNKKKKEEGKIKTEESSKEFVETRNPALRNTNLKHPVSEDEAAHHEDSGWF